MNNKKIHKIIISLLIGALVIPVFAADGIVDEKTKPSVLLKESATSGYTDRKSGVMDGNLILTLFYNFGGIGNWSIADRLNSGIYPKGSGRSYFAEFTPVIGAAAYSAEKKNLPIHIFSDGIVVASNNQMDQDENGEQLGFNPEGGYTNPLQDEVAMSDDEETWPDFWPNKTSDWDGRWNGQYGKYVRGDLETYFVMNDYANDEFSHYPFVRSGYANLFGDITILDETEKTLMLTTDDNIFDPSMLYIMDNINCDVVKVFNGSEDKYSSYYQITGHGDLDGNGLTNTLYLSGPFITSRLDEKENTEFSVMNGNKRGLGFTVDVRGYQWAHPAAEDIIIWTYWISNTSDVDYDETMFSMYGDADVGDHGDVKDDDAWFERENSIVYQYDHDGWSSQKGGFEPAYFGWRFLESPGNPMDSRDNDYDGMIDESQYDNIDNDGDWEVKYDDKGSDGIGPDDEGYNGPDPDGTEGNGIPDPGEPDFEYTDNDESDQIGLTSFEAGPWPGLLVSDDAGIWSQTRPGNFDNIDQTVDLTFLYGSGYFSLPSINNDSLNYRRKFSVAMVLGEDIDDIFNNAEVIQRIYDSDYAFAKPPRKPVVSVVPGDGRVTLYWDKTAEKSIDHIYGEDFEGYKIYRATDANFLEAKDITDAYGHLTFSSPIATYDIDNGLKGLHPVDYNGVHFNMGKDTGLQYSFVDTTVNNGQTYYYAVCSYDRGCYEGFYQNGWAWRDSLPEMQPSECTKRIEIDVLGNVVSTDDNTVVVVPNAPVAGYTPPSIAVNDSSIAGTGTVTVDFVDPRLVQAGKTYEIHFKDQATDGIDNDGDWTAWNDVPDGIWTCYVNDEDVTVYEDFIDWGLDGIADSLEENYNPEFNPDPAHDNYNKYTNMCDRFDNDMDGLIDSLDIAYDTTYVIDTTVTPWVYLDTVITWEYDDWGTENNHTIDWIDENGDGLYQKSEEGESFTDVGNGVLDPGETIVHDVGIDGILGTDDYGEGDGIPTPGIFGDPINIGEPNVDYRDNNERTRNTTLYSLIDVTDPSNPDTLLEDSPWIHGEVLNQFTHGMHVKVKAAGISVIESQSGFSNPNILFTHETVKYKDSIAVADNYLIQITDSVQFRSYNGKLTNFCILNNDTKDTVEFVYFPANTSGQLSVNDRIVPIIRHCQTGTASKPLGTWDIKITSKLPFVKQIIETPYGDYLALSGENTTQNYFGIFRDGQWHSVSTELYTESLLDLNCAINYSNSELWIGTSDGIFSYNYGQLSSVTIDTLANGEKNITAMIETDDGAIWIGSSNGITYVAGSVTTFFTNETSSVPSDKVKAFHEDMDGNLWVGTSDSAAFKLSLDGAVSVGMDNFPSLIVNAIEEDNTHLYFGTSNGIAVLNKTGQTWTTINGSLLLNKTVTSLRLIDGELWVGTDKGLNIISGDLTNVTSDNVAEYTVAGGHLRNDRIKYIFDTENDTVWIGTYQGFDYKVGDNWYTTAPEPGDNFKLTTTRPFYSTDVYVFETEAESVDKELAADEMDDISVVPNPYIAAASWEPAHLYTSGRGVRKIDFINLPQECTIKIFTLRGYLVKTIHHSSTFANGAESWNMTSKDGLDVAYGVYLYHVDAPGIGEKIGKFAIVK